MVQIERKDMSKEHHGLILFIAVFNLLAVGVSWGQVLLELITTHRVEFSLFAVVVHPLFLISTYKFWSLHEIGLQSQKLFCFLQVFSFQINNFSYIFRLSNINFNIEFGNPTFLAGSIDLVALTILLLVYRAGRYFKKAKPKIKMD